MDKLLESKWSSLHWAVLLCNKVGVKVAQDIYDADPLALDRPSRELVKESYVKSPAHLLCTSMQRSREQHILLNDFIIRNPKAFTVDSDGLGTLHTLAKYGNDTNVLQTIIQLAPNKISTSLRGSRH